MLLAMCNKKIKQEIMNRIILCLLLVVYASSVTAQSTIEPTTNSTFKIGVIPVQGVSTSFEKFDVKSRTTVLGYAAQVRQRSYSTLAYNPVQNSLILVQGVFLNEDRTQDIYVPLSKSLVNPGGYIGLGYEVG